MLNATEKKECYRLLEKLTDAEVKSLMDTVTRRQISPENKNEALQAIVEYSETAAELLRRKKVRRDIIFSYLASCKVIVSASAEKSELILRVLQLWGSSAPADLREIDSGTSLNAATARTDFPFGNGTSTSSTPPKPAGAVQPAVATQRSNGNSEQQTLAETFVRWFYQLLNSENPDLTNENGGRERGFGPHHFWENCTLKLVSRVPDVREEVFEGSSLVAQRLQALAQEERLQFNPNVGGEGVRVQTDSHGLMMVMVCGTIHQYNSCLGIFQQMFGLVRSPLNENTWKVKTSLLQLCSSHVTAMPKLTDFSSNELSSSSAPLPIMPLS